MRARNREPYLRVKAFFVEKGITYKMVSDVIGTTPNTVSKKINGLGGDFSLREVKILNAHFGLPTAYFFDLNVPKKEQQKEVG